MQNAPTRTASPGVALIAALRRAGRGVGVWTWPAHSLRTHLVLVVLIALLPALVTAVATGFQAIGRTRAVVDQRLVGTARMLARECDREIDTLIQLLLTLTALDGPATRLQSEATRIAAALGARLTIYDLAGTVTFETATAIPVATLPRLMGDLRDDLETSGRPRVSRLQPDAPDADPVVVLIQPIPQAGPATGFLALSLTPDILSGIIANPAQRPGRFAAVLDDEGHVATAAPPLPRAAGHRFADFALASPLPDQSSAEPHWIDGRVQIIARSRLLHAPGWQLIYSEDLQAIDSGMISPLLDSVGATLLAGCLSLLLAAILGARMSVPLRLLTAQARSIAIGADQPGQPMQPSSITEFEGLRLGMARADAVLRRRGAAERMALREARTGHELLVSVVNAAVEAISVKDVELRHMLVNRAALIAGPAPLEEWQILGRTSADLMPPSVASRIDAADRAVLATGRMTSFELELPRPDGTPQWRWITTTPWKSADGQIVGVVTVTRDVTEQRAAGRRLRGLQADLLRATRLSAMGAMAGGLAHEINQPLAAATNYVNAASRLLDRGLGGDPQSLAAAGRAAVDASQQLLRAGSIVRRLRDFVDRGEAQLEPEDAIDLIREACDLARGDGMAPGIDLVLAPDADPAAPRDIGADPAWPVRHRILADRTQLQQVLLNLIRNAAEAIASHGAHDSDLSLAPAGTPGHPGLITVAVAVLPEGTTITVSDNGPGIDPAIAERLFQPFASTKASGMGIGLVICRTIIEGHGGRLEAHPSAQGGAEFRIVLPTPRPAGD